MRIYRITATLPNGKELTWTLAASSLEAAETKAFREYPDAVEVSIELHR